MLAIVPLLAAANGPQETFLPPQTIPLSGTMRYDKIVVADVDGNHYDDLVAIGVDAGQTVIDVYINEGKTRASSETVNFFTPLRLILKTHPDADAVSDKVQFSPGYDVQVVDIDNDGYPDILASSASTGEIFVLWNQGPEASHPSVPFFVDRGPYAWVPFGFRPDTSDPTDVSLTLRSPLAQKLSSGKGGVLGTPIYVAALDLGDGSGYKSIVAYHGALQPTSSSDASSKLHYAPFNTHNYEALAIFHASGKHKFNLTEQRDKWPSCDMSFGANCAGWSDGMPRVLSESDFLNNFRVSNENGRGLSLAFADAPSDIMQMDDLVDVGMPTQFYKRGSYLPNASPGLQVLKGHGPGGSDSVWLQGAGRAQEFVADNSFMLMRRQSAIDTVIGNERPAGSTFGSLSTGATPLITAGGMRVVYDPSDSTSAVDESVPDYLNRPGQIGAWLGWAPLDSGPALLSLSDYCRAPDPCASQFYWFHKPLDGSPPPKYVFGGSSTLVMLDFARETSVASSKQFQPFFQAPDEAHFQAFTIRGGPVDHKPFIAAGHFASPSETALVMFDHADGDNIDPAWNHLSLYRPDTAKTYVSPAPRLDGLTVGRYIEDGLADVGITLPQGEISGVLVGTNLGVDTSDGIRYVTVHDKLSGAVKGIFPASPAETVQEIAEDGVVVPGLSVLPVGNYTLEVHNATASASMNLNVVNPFGITTTDFDWRAGSACGFLPNTKDADLWPKQIAVSVSNWPGSVQAVRWVNQDDSTVVNLGGEGATYNSATSTVTLIVPQGKLKDGHWRPAIKAGGMWQPIKRTWNVSHNMADLAACSQQVSLVNEEAYSQCMDQYYFLAPARYSEWPHIATGSFRFFGSGFALNQVKSAAIKQGSRRYFSSSLTLVDDHQVNVEFGDLSTSLTSGAATDLYFYSETGDVVAANGVPAVGRKQAWRTPMAGGCQQTPPNFSNITGGSGKDGAYQAGDVLTATGENLMSPVPTAIRLFLTDKNSGAQYALPSRLPDDFYETHYDNSHGKLLFAIPKDDEWDQYLVAPPTHLSGLPALQVAFTAQAGLTTVSEFTLSKLTVPGMLGWAFTEGIYMSGNTPTGVINYIKNAISPNPNPVPGMPGDDQPKNSLSPYVAIYVISSPSSEEYGIFAAVFLAMPGRIEDQAKFEIYTQGAGRYASTADISIGSGGGSCYPFPVAESACVVVIRPLDPNANIYNVWLPFLMMKWDYWQQDWKGNLASPIFEQSTSAAILAPTTFAPMSPTGQFFFQSDIPAKNVYTVGSQVLASFRLDQSNDCRAPYSAANFCYEKPIGP